MKKHILIIARNCPFPTTDGEKLRVYNIIKHLSKKYTLTLVYRAMSEEEIKHEQHLLQYCHKVLGILVPKPRNHFQRFRIALNTLLRGYPLVCAPYFFPAIHETLARKLDGQDYDAVQIEHSLLFPYLDSVACRKNCLKLVTVHNIDFIRFQRLLAQMPFSLRKVFYLLSTCRLKKIELSSLQKFDITLTMSETDRDLLVQNGFQGRMIPVPNGVDTKAITPADTPVVGKNIIFVGSLDYEANKDGVLWFVREIWPRVNKSIPEVRLILVGRNPGTEIRSYQSETISVTGTVDAVGSYYESARVCIVPLRSGGGTRLKVLEALAYGIPIVSTTLGCEGIEVRNGVDIIIADTPDSFASAIIDLVKDNDKWSSISSKGRKLAEDKYSWDKIVSTYDEILGANRHQSGQTNR